MTISDAQWEQIEDRTYYDRDEIDEVFSDISGVNREAIREEYAWIAKEYLRQKRGMRSEWDQSLYLAVESCGTVCCVAGHTVLNNVPEGYAVDPKVAGTALFPNDLHFADESDFHLWMRQGQNNQKVLDVEKVATEHLGLTYEQRDLLFDGDNTFKDVKVYMELLLGEKLPKAIDAVLVSIG